MKTQRVNLFLLAILTLSTPSVFSEDDDKNEIPSLELLEFLGNFQTSDGSWIDPIELDSLISKPEEMNTNNTELKK